MLLNWPLYLAPNDVHHPIYPTYLNLQEQTIDSDPIHLGTYQYLLWEIPRPWRVELLIHLIPHILSHNLSRYNEHEIQFILMDDTKPGSTYQRLISQIRFGPVNMIKYEWWVSFKSSGFGDQSSAISSTVMIISRISYEKIRQFVFSRSCSLSYSLCINIYYYVSLGIAFVDSSVPFRFNRL